MADGESALWIKFNFTKNGYANDACLSAGRDISNKVFMLFLLFTRNPAPMKITLNNNPEEFKEDILTVNQLLQKKNFTFKMLIVKINETLVKKQDYDNSVVKDGDNVEVLHLISGG
jgi:sulfur carrier protein